MTMLSEMKFPIVCQFLYASKVSVLDEHGVWHEVMRQDFPEPLVRGEDCVLIGTLQLNWAGEAKSST